MGKLIIPWRYKPKVWYWHLLRLLKRPETQVVWRGTHCHRIVNDEMLERMARHAQVIVKLDLRL